MNTIYRLHIVVVYTIHIYTERVMYIIHSHRFTDYMHNIYIYIYYIYILDV